MGLSDSKSWSVDLVYPVYPTYLISSLTYLELLDKKFYILSVVIFQYSVRNRFILTDEDPDVKTLDLKHSIRLRGSHKKAFTCLENCLDTLVKATINKEDQLCETAAVLSNIKTKALSIQWCKLKIQRETWVDANFSGEVDFATDFVTRSDITIARITVLFENYKDSFELSDPTSLRSQRSAVCKLR